MCKIIINVEYIIEDSGKRLQGDYVAGVLFCGAQDFFPPDFHEAPAGGRTTSSYDKFGLWRLPHTHTHTHSLFHDFSPLGELGHADIFIEKGVPEGGG